MNFYNYLSAIVAVVIILGLGGLVFFRGRPDTQRQGDSLRRITRRNSLISAVIVVVFLGVWFQRYTTGDLAASGIVGWKAVVGWSAFGLGVCSVILLLYSMYKR